MEAIYDNTTSGKESLDSESRYLCVTIYPTYKKVVFPLVLYKTYVIPLAQGVKRGFLYRKLDSLSHHHHL